MYINLSSIVLSPDIPDMYLDMTDEEEMDDLEDSEDENLEEEDYNSNFDDKEVYNKNMEGKDLLVCTSVCYIRYRLWSSPR